MLSSAARRISKHAKPFSGVTSSIDANELFLTFRPPSGRRTIMARVATEEEKQIVAETVARARVALKQIESYDQAKLDRLIQAVGWAVANEKTFQRLSDMGIDESGLG